MPRSLHPRSYSVTRTVFGLVLVTLWIFTSHGAHSDISQAGLLPLLCYGTLQLFEGLARYERGPSLPTMSPVQREIVALGFVCMMTVAIFLSEAEADEEMPPGGQAVGIVFAAALLHFMTVRRDARVNTQLEGVRLGIAFAVGVALVVCTASAAHLRIIETMGLPLIAVSAAMLTMPAAWRAWEKRLIYEARAGLLDEDLRERVERAERGAGDDLLLRLHEAGDVTHVFVGHADDSELDVPVDTVPDMKEGDFILVRGARIVTATRGGEGYRGTEEYERLEGAERITRIGELPLPEPPKRPLPPIVVEAALLIAIVLITVLAFVAGEWAL